MTNSPEPAGTSGSGPSSGPDSAATPAEAPAPPVRPARSGRARAEIAEPTPAELAALPADRRFELLQQQRQFSAEERDRRRQSRHQWFNSAGILFGVLFAAAGLVATALTWKTGQDQLETARQGQLTDRYIRATEQLGSATRDVRTSAVYALERLADDSSRDRSTITAVLAAFVREHDPAPDVPEASLPQEPDTDVLAALTALGRLPAPTRTDLHGVRVPGAALRSTDLSGANLLLADLSKANLGLANLSRTTLTGAKLNSAQLNGADLSRTYALGVSLRGADLTGANLTGAFLSGADLTGANLTDAHLEGADLTQVVGLTPEQIRAVARTDTATDF
ncbi:pentapeptide repeat-containing protein [Kitasatospora sp. NPDC090091]|uniref:pentapeptide repeat-containing protein n=1 Tax=Kitasatospora sp. NPDC090091 TaxID=3364081 RepID=UPI003826C992